jgi:hypothetical protein
MLKKTTLALSALVATTVAVPAAAEAQSYGYYPSTGYQQPYYGQRYANRYYGKQAYNQRYYGQRYNDRYRCKSGTTGAIVGGAAGALLGREVQRQSSRDRYYYGNRNNGTVGAIIGGAVGALVGRQATRTC